jgi:hypothetical protein
MLFLSYPQVVSGYPESLEKPGFPDQEAVSQLYYKRNIGKCIYVCYNFVVLRKEIISGI